MNNKFKIAIISLFTIVLFDSCLKDLDTIPLDTTYQTAATIYNDTTSYKKVLAKIYGGLAMTGQEGPAGLADIKGIDEGFGQYLRMYWYHQEFTTEEAVTRWNDQTIFDFHYQSWGPGDGFTFALYSRLYYQIAICNEFLRQTSDDKLSDRGVSSKLKQAITGYRSEVRFLRALSYWHALDLFRNVPFVTEKDPIGSFLPKQTNANDLFAFIESELKDIEGTIAPANTNEYGRADAGAVWTLLSKLYLNAEVYTGAKKYTECLTYCKKVLNSGYTLEPEFQNLFLADNNESNEIIFPITFDGLRTRTYGGTTFIIDGSIGGSMNPSDQGVTEAWKGTRTTRQLVDKFGKLGANIIDFYTRKNKPQVYLFGEFQGNKINTDQALTDANGDKIYMGYQYFDKDNVTFNLAPNPSTSYFLGDSNGDGIMEVNGAPVSTGTAGFYYIEFNNTNKKYKIEKRNWVVTGSAVNNQNIPFVWDGTDNQLVLNTNLVPGQLYFKASGDENITLGDNDANGILTHGGKAIVIEEATPVEIRLDLRKEEFIYRIASTSYDRRALFYSDGQNLDINDLTLFTDGYAVNKFKNIKKNGSAGSDNRFPDTDFPMFRLADIYLMASEAILRGASGGSLGDAVAYFNAVRSRAFHSSLANLSTSTLNLNEILDERAREFFWECHRRTDLVRFGQFTDGSYLWQWKGGVKEGKQVPSYRNVFPIPSADLSANPNLKQNPGY